MNNKLSITLGFLQSIIAVFAILSFFVQLLKPEMALMGIDEGMKDNFYITGSIVAGFVLTIISGTVSIVCASLSFLKKEYAGYMGLLLGMFLPAWIIVRFNLVGYINFWQIVFLLTFILEIVISLVLIRRIYRKKSEQQN